MVGTKNNGRVQYTKNKLKEALLQLLKDRPLSKVTITQLCNVAGINRGTFYAHYSEPSDLFTAIETDLIDTIKPMLNSHQEDMSSWLPSVLEVIKEKDAATQIIISSIDNSPLLQTIFDSIRTKSIQEYRNLLNESDPVILEYYFEFCLSGAVHIITSWLRSGAKESPDKISEIINQLVPNGTNSN